MFIQQKLFALSAALCTLFILHQCKYFKFCYHLKDTVKYSVTYLRILQDFHSLIIWYYDYLIICIALQFTVYLWYTTFNRFIHFTYIYTLYWLRFSSYIRVLLCSKRNSYYSWSFEA